MHQNSEFHKKTEFHQKTEFQQKFEFHKKSESLPRTEIHQKSEIQLIAQAANKNIQTYMKVTITELSRIGTSMGRTDHILCPPSLSRPWGTV